MKMLKKFIKNNITVSSLLLLSLIIVNINFFRFFKNTATYQFDSWMSNYQGGFVRRGLPGELLFQLHSLLDIHLGWMVFIFVCSLYILFYLLFFLLISKIEINKIFLLAIFSPISFYFPILNSKATGHKEIIFLLSLVALCYFIPSISKKGAKNLIIFISLVLGLSHEGLLFYCIYLIIPYLLFFNFKSYKEILLDISSIITFLLILFIINFIFSGNEQHVIDICNSIKEYANDKCQISGQIAHFDSPIKGYFLQKISNYWYADYFRIYGIGFLFGFLPLFFLYSKIISTNLIFGFSKINSLYILIFPLLITFPIYVLGADWGRYLYISYTSSLIILVFILRNNIYHLKKENKNLKDNMFLKLSFVILLLFYSFGWSVPICCENKFKSGIFKSFDRVMYYYIKNK